jgi:hypothetical protein
MIEDEIEAAAWLRRRLSRDMRPERESHKAAPRKSDTASRSCAQAKLNRNYDTAAAPMRP